MVEQREWPIAWRSTAEAHPGGQMQTTRRWRSRRPRQMLVAAVTVAFVTAVAGCGAVGAPDPATSDTPNAASSSAATSSAATSSAVGPSPSLDTAEPSGSPSTSGSPDPTGSPSPSGSASPTPTIDPSTGERRLGLGDFFNPTTNWSEDRFVIPVVGEVTGIGSETNNCDKGEAIELEFRDDTQYKTLSLMASPSKTTLDSSKNLVVAVYNNENFIDSVTVGYGTVARLRGINIQSVSALKIRMYLDDKKGCNTKGVFGVVYDIRVV